MMLTEICQELRNWFDRGQKKWIGEVTILRDGLLVDGAQAHLQSGQYFRIVGSLFNDGVHKVGDAEDALTPEEPFSGAVWSMAIPPAVISLAEDIAAWQEKYGHANSQAMSPFNSESFGGYSYSKSAGASSSGSGGAGAPSWKSTFAKRLNMWRKI